MDFDKATECLTPRELEVLRLVAEGVSNRDIAEALCLSLNTVKTHLRHIYQKLGINSRVQAVMWYMNNEGHEGTEE